MVRREGSARLWIASGLSVLVHLLLGAAVARLPSTDQPDAASDSPSPRAPLPPPPPETPEVKVGIEQSRHATITWIGFEAPAEHQAPQAETEQPALTRDAPSSPVQPTETHTETQPTPEQAVAATEPARHSEPAPRPEPATASAENRGGVTQPSPISQTATAGPLLELPPDGGIPILLAAPIVGIDPQRASPAEPEPAPQEPQTAASPASPTPPAPAQPERAEPAETPPGEEPRRGEVDPRESDPTSMTKPVVVRPGRPAATEGLEIETRHLRLSIYGQVRAMPARLKVWVTFDRRGRVRNVEWVAQTGIKELDEPVLDCVYSWRARGKALDALPKDDPKAGVRVPFEIVLR